MQTKLIRGWKFFTPVRIIFCETCGLRSASVPLAPCPLPLARRLRVTRLTLAQHFNNWWILLFGRVTGGVATSLLFSVFEAWMTKEHNARSFHPSLLDSTFSRAALISAVVASTSGQLADAVHEAFDVPLCVGSAGTTTPAPCNNTTHMVP